MKALSDNGNKGRYIYLNRNGSEFVGVSPERLFSVRDGVVRSEAMAGTRPRGQDPEDDRRLEEEVRGRGEEGARTHGQYVC